MKSIMSSILFSTLAVCSFASVSAQSVFNRNDNYDFAGRHYLRATGSDPDNFSILIESGSDFRLFKLHITLRSLDLGPYWFGNQYRVDMNNDGVWELNWDALEERTITFQYPNPPDGIIANHTIKIEIRFGYLYGGSADRTKYHQVTIFSTPRVYVNSENDAFVQLRDEDASAKIPVLMVEGFDPLNDKFPEVYYNLTWDLINTDLYPNGYEVFILNFHDGGRDLRPNAEVVLKAVEKIGEICPTYKIAVAGLSMGGPITRFALAKREGQGRPHGVGLFLSYDSPQRWAHVSPDLQDWIKLQDPNDGAIGTLQANLQSVGAKQMLGYNTYDPSHSFRNEFYNQLNALNGDGYPHQSYNVSVSNGTFDATWGYESIGRHLMRMRINSNLIKDVPAVALDCGPGSMITDITTRRYGDVLHNPLIHIYYQLEIIFNPAYTTTWSALDLVGEQINPTTGDITSFERSKFDDYVVQPEALQHHELSTVTRNKIMQWLDLDFNVGVTYSLIEGGSADPDNHQVNILHGIPITVQPKVANVNGQPVTHYFSHWFDGNTSNPRTFFASHDVSHAATMKGHLLSTNSVPIANNNQRKLVTSDGRNYYLVYESAGSLWRTTSTNAGSTWTPDVRVTPIGVFSTAASLVVQGTSAVDPTIEYELHTIYRRGNGPGYEIWEGTRRVSSIGSFVPGGPRPALGRFNSPTNNRPTLLALWEGGLNPVTPGPLKWSTSQFNAGAWGIWQPEQALPVSNPGDRNPSIANGHELSPRRLYVSYDNGGDILFTSYGTNPVWAPPALVPASISRISFTSQIAADVTSPNTSEQNVHIVWEALNDAVSGTDGGESWPKNDPGQPKHTVMYQRFTGGWLPAHEFVNANGHFYHPTVTQLSTGTVLWAWDDGSSAYKAVNTGSGWVITEVYESAVFPNFAGAGAGDLPDESKFVSVSTGSAPYHLQFSTGASGQVEEVYSRRVEAVESAGGLSGDGPSGSRGSFSLSLKTIELKLADGSTTSVWFVPVADSMRTTEDNAWETMASVPFVLPASVDSVIVNGVAKATSPARIIGNGHSSVRLAFDLVDARDGRRLQRLENERLFVRDSVHAFRIRDRVAGYAGREVAIRPQVLGIVRDKAGILYSTVHTHTIRHDTTTAAGGSLLTELVSEVQGHLPTMYALHSNYPNPFNPTTTIRFDLPEPGSISLAIFDVLGRRVAELANGHHVAGYHSTTWNAADQASGIYFARFTVAGAAGEVKYSKVNKLVVMK